jgi:hypothetical protein
MPHTIPNGPFDTASFSRSNRGNVSLSANTEINAINFDSSASSFTISIPPALLLNISGSGISNSSASSQSFVTQIDTTGLYAGVIQFNNSATAGNSTFINPGGFSTDPQVSGLGGQTQFLAGSSAANAVFYNYGGQTFEAQPGATHFFGNSTAGSGIFYNYDATIDVAIGGSTFFDDDSSAANAEFNSVGGFVAFFERSSAGSATFNNSGAIHNGGQIYFFDEASAANARFVVNGTTKPGTYFSDVDFFGSSNAGFAHFTANASKTNNQNAAGGVIFFFATSSAFRGVFTLRGTEVENGVGSFLEFLDQATAQNATINAGGGATGEEAGGNIYFSDDSSGGSATIKLYGTRSWI